MKNDTTRERHVIEKVSILRRKRSKKGSPIFSQMISSGYGARVIVAPGIDSLMALVRPSVTDSFNRARLMLA